MSALKGRLLLSRMGRVGLAMLFGQSLPLIAATVSVPTVTDCKTGLRTVITGEITLPATEKTGEGGHGSVRMGLADDGVTPVAIKTANDESTLKYLRRDANYLNRLNEGGGHPAIPKFYGLKKTPEGEVALVSEWVDGITYKKHLEGAKLTSETFKEKTKTFLSQMKELYAGLRYIHSKGVVHLDIKPENVMLDKNGKIKIVDYGISSGFFEHEGKIFLTAENLKYSKDSGAPELLLAARGKDGAEVGPAADFYTMGYIMNQWAKRVDGPLKKPDLDTNQKRALLNIKEFINELLRSDPSSRPTPEQIEATFRDLEMDLDRI